METDSSDEDSGNSIPRPIYEAISAIESPQPMLQSEVSDMEPVVHNKRLKYVVSAPPPPANGSSSSSSSTAPATGHGNAHHLTMKLTKVTRMISLPSSESKPAQLSTSTPRQEGKVRVPKELLALKKSHNDSKVLTGYVAEVSTLKRHKSRSLRLLTSGSSKQEDLHSHSLPGKSISDSAASPAKRRHGQRTLKRSKSIPAHTWDSDEDWRDDEDLLDISKRKSKKQRRLSESCDSAERMNYAESVENVAESVAESVDLVELSAEDSNSNQASGQRLRCRSKTVSLLSDSWSNEERQPRRSNLRSENEEFAKKHSAFLDRIINDPVDYALDSAQAETEAQLPSGEWQTTSSVTDTDANISTYSDASEQKIKQLPSLSLSLPKAAAGEKAEQRLSELWQAPPRDGWDPFCWKCREGSQLMPCSKCLRSFHPFCVRPASTKFDSAWKCPECLLVESAPKRPRRNDVAVGLLSQLLAYALERMKLVRGVHKLRAPMEVLPHSYKKYFVNPVNFKSLAERIRNHAFHSADEFLSEVKWMQHNALILDAGDIKVEQASKAVVKVCRQEANEIDTCPECYLNANSSEEWFVKVCTQPHLLLWAKLKGFPYWPAKAMGSSGPNAVVNVRFFGKHDRANVPVRDCFLYSAQDPNTQTSRRSARDLAECIKEVEVHIENIKSKIGSFNYAPYRTPYDPLEEQQQLELMMPGVQDCIDRQQSPANKTPLQFLIRKTAGDGKLSIVKKSKATESGNESDQSLSPSKPLARLLPDNIEAMSSEHAKLKQSSNYEVIPKLADTESRGCTVILKRKSLEANKAAVATATLATGKRKHSLSDDASCSSEASQQGSAEQRSGRRGKHARRQLEAAKPSPKEEKAVINTKDESVEPAKDPIEEAATTTSPAAVVSVVELVRRRQGVTITKIPREQQQLAKSTEPAKETPPPPPPPLPPPPPPPAPDQSEAAAACTTEVKQREVERQQQQLISKVVPFVEIKSEVLSEHEEMEATPPRNINNSPAPSRAEEPPVPAAEATPAPKPAAVPAPAVPLLPLPLVQHVPLTMKIKEEVISDEETEQSNILEQPAMPPPALPAPTPPSRVEQTVANSSTSSSGTATTAADSFVRFVGDTTIQRLSGRQTASSATPSAASSATPSTTSSSTFAQRSQEPTPRRGGLRGVVHGPLPAAAQSPAPSPSPPAKQPSPAQISPKLLLPAQKSTTPQNQQLRLKTDKPQTTTPPPSTTSNLLRSNMVVIPGSVNGIGSSSNLVGSGLMAIPVPPLTAVSKNTLQATNVQSLLRSSIPPPPLAGLTGGAVATTTTAEPGLLANALNGIVNSETMAPPPAPAPPPSSNEPSAQNELMTTGLATALSEILLRSGPPKLLARPSGPLHSDGGSNFPSQAGPVSQRLKDNAHRITDYFISVIEDTVNDLGTEEPNLLQARITTLTLENERIKMNYERQMADLQRSTDLIVAEMRKTLENENKRVMNELRQQGMLERIRAVEEAKKKQWCANCQREAQLYCCWNTSYCDYPCQQMHWARHSTNCGQAANLQAEAARGKQKSANTASPNHYPQQQSHKTPPAMAAATAVTTAANHKRWQQPQQPLISVLSPPNAEVLKLPTNTYLRPVSALPATLVTMTNNITTTGSLITPHGGSTTITAGQRSANIYGGKPSPNSLPVQRFNIPLPITVSGTTATYGLIAEPQPQQQQQKLAPKSHGRSSSKNNSRARNHNMSGNSQGLRQSQQLNQVFQQ